MAKPKAKGKGKGKRKGKEEAQEPQEEEVETPALTKKLEYYQWIGPGGQQVIVARINDFLSWFPLTFTDRKSVV